MTFSPDRVGRVERNGVVVAERAEQRGEVDGREGDAVGWVEKRGEGAVAGQRKGDGEVRRRDGVRKGTYWRETNESTEIRQAA